MTTYRPHGPAGRRSRASLPFFMAFLLMAGVVGCDFLDPTKVENPLTTADDLADAEEPVRALLPGLRAQFARMVGSQVVVSETTSDNYSVHGTGMSGAWDAPADISPSDLNSTGAAEGIYWNTQELRALADFVLNDIAPGDATATNSHLAEIHYYRGMAYIYQAENFTHVPVEPDGPALPATDLFQRGVADLEASLNLSASGDFAIPATAGLARAYRGLGNAPQAIAHAEAALGADAGFVFQQLYDASSIQNLPWVFLVLRALKEMQPLPRVDFLDPKYIDQTSGIAVAKAEEMHLILAEAALAAGSLGDAQGHLADAINLALSRGTDTFTDNDERLNGNLTIRPRDSEIVVRADANSPFRAGLILDRPGVEIPVPTVSGTSLDADSIQALTDAEDIWHAFHLARQEILFLEGRRMSDLGIRLPMMLREIDQNATISEGDPGTFVVVPAYLPSGSQINQFSPSSPYDANDQLVETQITILVDMNRILATNQVNAFN
jgi:tetratricopeptide (TPR) repeat protein